MSKKFLAGACIVLCNHLDGAVADFEMHTTVAFDFIVDCIAALKQLGDPSWKKYYDRVMRVLDELETEEN